MQHSPKVILVGDSKVGKTGLIRKLLDLWTPSESYVPTLGVAVHPVVIGGKTYNFWDTAGVERYGGLRDGYYIGADAAVAVYNNEELRASRDWVADVRRVCPGIPILRCVNLPSATLASPDKPQENVYFANLRSDGGVARLMTHLESLHLA